jgi:hypothetical protein
MNNEINLEKEDLDTAINCMRNSLCCYQQAPYLMNEERNKHIKKYQEMVIKCYLEILRKK